MDATLESMQYDANKLPLGEMLHYVSPILIIPRGVEGKLAKSTISSGFEALKVYFCNVTLSASILNIRTQKIAEAIEKPTGDLANSLGGQDAACGQLSGEYYS
jgi:hypothetical protein